MLLLVLRAHPSGELRLDGPAGFLRRVCVDLRLKYTVRVQTVETNQVLSLTTSLGAKANELFPKLLRDLQRLGAIPFSCSPPSCEGALASYVFRLPVDLPPLPTPPPPPCLPRTLAQGGC